MISLCPNRVEESRCSQGVDAAVRFPSSVLTDL